MGKSCERLTTCGFFRKYYGLSNVAHQGFVMSQGFIEGYCKGPLQCQCKRLAHFIEHGVAPSDDMMPDGRLVRQAADSNG